MEKKIVVGVDGSEGGAAALRWAARQAELSHQPLEAVLAWGLLDQHHPDPSDPFDPRFGEAKALEALNAYLEATLGDRSAGIDRRVVCSLAAPALLDASAGAALLVVGTRGAGGFRRLLVGSVSHQCVQHASCPVAVVREDGDGRGDGIDRIVVGIDGSHPAQQALRWALAEARIRKASVEVVHAWQLPMLGAYPYAIPMSDSETYEEAARRVMDASLAEEDLSGLQKPVDRTLVSKAPTVAILEAAKGADLVVVGSRGRGGFLGLLLGSISNQVLHHAPCSVVVVPPGG